MKKLLRFLLLAPFVLTAQDFWTEVAPFPSSTGTSPIQISIVDNSDVWVLGIPQGAGSVEKWSRSLDGGVTWTSGSIDLGSADLHVSCLHAVSNSVAYVTTFSEDPATFGGVWATNDSGATWSQQISALFNTSDSFANFIYFFDVNQGLVMGDACNGFFEMYLTSDGGATWTLVQTPALVPVDEQEYGLTDKFATAGNSIFIPTTFGRILKSDDRGATWTVSQAPVPDFGGGINGSESASLSFINANDGLIQTSDYLLYSTNDGGNTWADVTWNGTFRNFGMTAVPQTTDTYFNWGEDDSITRGASYSQDGGMSWIDLNSLDSDPVDPYVVKFQSGTVGYSIGTYVNDATGTLKFFRLSDPLNLLSNKQFIKTSVLSAVPNPTTGIVKISGNAINEITICDISGKIVLAQKYNAIKGISLDISALQNGIYLAKVISDNRRTETIKIMKN